MTERSTIENPRDEDSHQPPPIESEEAEEAWIAPPFQPVRALSALVQTAAGFGLYEYVLLQFWSSPLFGIHDPIPWPAFAGMAIALLLCLLGLRSAIRIWSPHIKLALSLLAFFACAAVAVGGGRFVSYAMRGTLNPAFRVNLKVGDHFPSFTLPDQAEMQVRGPSPGAKGSLVVVYRGDFDPFARFELADLEKHLGELKVAGLSVIAISADPVDRSKMLSAFLHTDVPLLSDVNESILRPLGLVQRHRNGEPDNAIPAYFLLDREGVVRWIFAPYYYRQLPTFDNIPAAVNQM